MPAVCMVVDGAPGKDFSGPAAKEGGRLKPMSLTAMLLLALSLAMDAFAVSVATGIAADRLRGWLAIKTGLFFGSFQCLMPLLGYLAGSTVSAYLQAVDHWIAFALLGFIGGQMIAEGCRGGEQETVATGNLRLLTLSVATSVDALAVGVGLSAIGAEIWPIAQSTGLVTFALCVFGVCLGKRLGARFLNRAMVLGGLVLCGIGIKILLDHLL